MYYFRCTFGKTKTTNFHTVVSCANNTIYTICLASKTLSIQTKMENRHLPFYELILRELPTKAKNGSNDQNNEKIVFDSEIMKKFITHNQEHCYCKSFSTIFTIYISSMLNIYNFFLKHSSWERTNRVLPKKNLLLKSLLLVFACDICWWKRNALK